jgi:hypothetical protein
MVVLVICAAEAADVIRKIQLLRIETRVLIFVMAIDQFKTCLRGRGLLFPCYRMAKSTKSDVKPSK